MPTEQEVTDALATLADYVHDIGDRVTHKDANGIMTGELNNEVGSIEMRGHQCESDEEIYYIGAHPEFRGALVVYYLSLTGSIASELSYEYAQEILANSPTSVDQGDPRAVAAKHLLQEMDEREVQNFISKLKIRVADTDYNLSIHEFEDGGVESFSIDSVIFPYEGGFGIKEFNDAVVSVLSGGSRGGEIVATSTQLSIDEDNPENTELSFTGV